MAISLNLVNQVHPVIWTLSHLPFDCLQAMPVPKPIGKRLGLSHNLSHLTLGCRWCGCVGHELTAVFESECSTVWCVPELHHGYKHCFFSQYASETSHLLWLIISDCLYRTSTQRLYLSWLCPSCVSVQWSSCAVSEGRRDVRHGRLSHSFPQSICTCAHFLICHFVIL